MSAVTIRVPRGRELVACRMRLPECFNSPVRSFLLALSGEAPQIAGAATMLRLPGAMDAVELMVVPAFRRQGIGTRLLAQFEEQARACGAGRISGWIRTLGETAGATFAEARGFRRVGRLTRYACDSAPFMEYHWRLRQQLQERGRIPPDARIVKLDHSNREALARLWGRYIASHPHPRLDLYEHRLAAGLYDESPVLVHHLEVAGFLLARMDGRKGLVDAKVLAPECRGGAALPGRLTSVIDHYQKLTSLDKSVETAR